MAGTTKHHWSRLAPNQTVERLERKKKKNRPQRLAASVSDRNRRNRQGQQEGTASHEGITISRKMDFSTTGLLFPASSQIFREMNLIRRRQAPLTDNPFTEGSLRNFVIWNETGMLVLLGTPPGLHLSSDCKLLPSSVS